ncbi:MAG TPA: type II and III secretion system protein [Bacteroidota bacterium]
MNMHTFHRYVAVVLMLFVAGQAFSQKTPAERRTFKEYTPPESLVSIAPTATFDKALNAISEVSKKFTGKIVIDTERRDFPVGIDIQGMAWRDALEAICRKNSVWYTEFESYIQITTTAGQGGQTVAGGPTGSTKIEKEVANIKSREITISAIFFEVNLTRTEEVGINWTFMKSTNDADFDANFSGADLVKGTGEEAIFEAGVTPKISFANLSFVAKLFSNYDLGEILSNPQIIVRSGEEGRIQVGQDFSIRERDFAGNIIDKFYSSGTIVKVTPQVISEQGVNFIHLEVDVERSNVVPGQISTIINKTKANTNLLLLDGEETIIGGLYNTDESTIRTGIPFLKDLPWYVFGLRYLFGYEKQEVSKKELVILLKADLVPTLQERITQRTNGTVLYKKWQQERMNADTKLRGREQ